MYLKVGEEFADGELFLLSDLLSLLDVELLSINGSIVRSSDPESEGLLDRGEYLIGLGFCAMQQYLVDTLTLTGVSKKEALAVGPPYSDGLPIVAVVNAAANWWKHQAEWYSGELLSREATRTRAVILGVLDGAPDYALSQVLANLVEAQGLNDLKLSGLLPHLVAWRADVDQLRMEK